MSEVDFPCGHKVTVKHEYGGRIVCCDNDDCDMRAIVQAKRVVTIQYIVQPKSTEVLGGMSEEDARRQQQFDIPPDSVELISSTEEE